MIVLSFALMWAPGLIGWIVGLALYGVGTGQFIFYMRAFPRDRFQLKALVLVVYVFDSTQTLTSIYFYYHFLIKCRSNASPDCATYVPPLTTFGVCILYWVTFIVQSFYAHRVWIISGQNRVITSAVVMTALTQLFLGMLVTVNLIRKPTLQDLFTMKVLPLTGVASAVCDAIITMTITYYLRPARTGVIRQGNYIKKLNAIFVQMGLFSFINSSAVVIFYYAQNGGESFLISAPGVILSKTYANSMLSVLNARKPIRDEQQARVHRTIEIPTIPTILSDVSE